MNSMTDKAQPDWLNRFPLSNCLNTHDIAYLQDKGQIQNFEKGESVFKKGHTQNKIFFVISGTIKITKASSQGKEVIKKILTENSIINLKGLAGEAIHKDEASVLSQKAQIFELDIREIDYMITQNPALAICIIHHLGQSLDFIESRIESLALEDARERVVDFIKANAETHGKTLGVETLLKHDFTQQDIADYTGTSRQTVTTVLNDLKNSNKIYMKRKSILIRDIKSLR